MQKRIFINNQIRANEVRLIDETGAQIGVLSLEKAIEKAKEKELDLIQVSDKVTPPICKIGDYGKYVYQTEKKEKEMRKKNSMVSELKGIRLSFNISSHDMETRANTAIKFLKNGDKVKVELRLKGREKALGQVAENQIRKFIEIINNTLPTKVEKELKREARGFTMIITKVWNK